MRWYETDGERIFWEMVREIEPENMRQWRILKGRKRREKVRQNKHETRKRRCETEGASIEKRWGQKKERKREHQEIRQDQMT